MIVFEDLPYEISEYIHKHKCSMCIQNAFRRHMYKFVQCPEWRYLFPLLMTYMDTECLEVFFENYHVRREWRSEPLSWILTLTMDNEEVYQIISEVYNGLW